MKTGRVVGALFACVVAVAAASPLRAAGYPERNIRLVVSSAGGTAPDIVARLIGAKLAEQFGQGVIVENKPGANGSLAAGEVARAAPDGYTFLVTPAGTLTANPHLYPQSASAALSDLSPVTQIATVDFIVAARKSLNVRTMGELLAQIRDRPGKLTAATTAHGSFPHLAAEMLKQNGKLDFVIAKHNGGAAAGTTVAGDHADFVIETAAVLEPLVTAGKLVALASTNTGRSARSPDLPTVGESGIENFSISGWIAVVAPKGTPFQVRETMQRAIATAVADETVRERLAALHFVVVASSPSEFERTVARERTQLGEIIKRGGLVLE